MRSSTPRAQAASGRCVENTRYPRNLIPAHTGKMTFLVGCRRRRNASSDSTTRSRLSANWALLSEKTRKSSTYRTYALTAKTFQILGQAELKPENLQHQVCILVTVHGP